MGALIIDSRSKRTLSFSHRFRTLFAERVERALPTWMERAFQLLYKSKVWFVALVFLLTHITGIYIL